MKITRLGPRRFRDYILRLWPAYRKRQDEETKAAIKWLCEHPEAPCIIGNSIILNAGEGAMSQDQIEAVTGRKPFDPQRGYWP
jgi:hypothetical protein